MLQLVSDTRSNVICGLAVLNMNFITSVSNLISNDIFYKTLELFKAFGGHINTIYIFGAIRYYIRSLDKNPQLGQAKLEFTLIIPKKFDMTAPLSFTLI